MKASLEAIKTATRVLAALTEKKPPNPEDVEILRRLDGAEGAEDARRDLDELACDVIQKALKHRAEARSAHTQ